MLDDLDVECSSEVEFAEHFVVEVDVDCLSPALLCSMDAERVDERSVMTNDIPCGQKKRPKGFEGPGSALDSMCMGAKQSQSGPSLKPEGRPNSQRASPKPLEC